MVIIGGFIGGFIWGAVVYWLTYLADAPLAWWPSYVVGFCIAAAMVATYDVRHPKKRT